MSILNTVLIVLFAGLATLQLIVFVIPRAWIQRGAVADCLWRCSLIHYEIEEKAWAWAILGIAALVLVALKLGNYGLFLFGLIFLDLLTFAISMSNHGLKKMASLFTKTRYHHAGTQAPMIPEDASICVKRIIETAYWKKTPGEIQAQHRHRKPRDNGQ